VDFHSLRGRKPTKRIGEKTWNILDTTVRIMVEYRHDEGALKGSGKSRLWEIIFRREGEQSHD